MSESRTCRLSVQDEGDVTVVTFDRHPLDELTAPVVADELFRLADARPGRRLRLSFANVEYLSSAILGVLITLNKKLVDGGGKLALCDMSPRVYEVFDITKLDHLIEIAPPKQ